MKNVFKAQAMARDLAVRLKNRITGLTVTQSQDSDRFPVLQCAVSSKSVWIRIKTDSARSTEDGHVDGLGLAQTVYAPHMTEILQEDAAGATPIAAGSLNLRAQVLAECSKNGTKIVVREGEGVEDDTTFAAADAAATTTVATIRSDDIHPLTAQM